MACVSAISPQIGRLGRHLHAVLDYRAGGAQVEFGTDDQSTPQSSPAAGT